MMGPLHTLIIVAACGHGIRAGVDPATPAPTGDTAASPTPTVLPTAAPTADTAPPTPSPTGSTGSTGDTGAGVVPWAHTATVDGSADEYGPDETFAVAGGTFHLTWDATTLYLAATHPDVATGGPQHWLLVYLGDGQRGATSGVPLNTQQPQLAVPMTHLVRYKADGSYDDLMAFTGGTEWSTTAGWLSAGPGQVAEAGQTVELAIPLAGISDDTLVVAAYWLFEGEGYESSYAALPAAAFIDGYDPDVGLALSFDRSSAAPPSAQASEHTTQP